jgi:multimeric flavodoxin WrbA
VLTWDINDCIISGIAIPLLHLRSDAVSKKIVGLSFGRKNGNSETFLKTALMAAEEEGMETEIIRAIELKITPCIACGACFKTRKCPYDDTDWILENTTLPGDALILAAPVYHIRPPTTLICVTEKINHFFFKNPVVHERKKLSAAISVGGSGYDGWTSLGLPIIHLYLQHFSTLVDQVQIDHCCDIGAALTLDNKWAIDRCRQMGHNLAKAMSLPLEEVKYVGGDSPISCPVCHCNVFYLEKGLPDIACPTCRVHGQVSYADGKYSVVWNEYDMINPRFSKEGQLHHMQWIKRHLGEETPQIAIPETQAMMKQYQAFGKYLQPPKNSK